MTVACLIVQPHAAYVIADAGVFRPDGTIFDLWPKVFASDGYVYAGGGSAVVLCWVRDAGRRRFGQARFDPDGFMALVREAYESNGLDPTTHFTRWVAAGWCPEHDEPVGLEFYTSERDADEMGEPAFEWHRYRWLLQPPTPDAELAALGYQPGDLSDPSRFQPERDAMKLVQHFRHRRTSWGGDPTLNGCFVAGKIILAKVTRHGVEMSLLHDYPDIVGERAGAQGDGIAA